MAEDYARNMGPVQAQHRAYERISNMLSTEGRILDEFPTMPQLPGVVCDDDDNLVSEEAMETGSSTYLKLNDQQKEIVDSILNCVDNNDFNKCSFYIDAPGSLCKTFMYNTLWYLAVTINKSQGQTFELTAIDLRRNVYNHGQLYVAPSRVRSWDSVRVYFGDQQENTIVKNPVYKKLYQ